MRVVYAAVGSCFVALGVVGAFMPVLPTTPFLLLAAGCYARSSTRLYDWLVTNRIFGPMIREWQRSQSLPSRTKLIAILMVAVSLTLSALAVATTLYHVAAFLMLGAALILMIVRIPTTQLQ